MLYVIIKDTTGAFDVTSMGCDTTIAVKASLSARLLADNVKDPEYQGPSDQIVIEGQKVQMLSGTSVLVDITVTDEVHCEFASNFNTAQIAEDLIAAWRKLGIGITRLTVIVRATGRIAWGQAV